MERIWPYDPESAVIINEIVKWLIIENDNKKALESTKGIGTEAFNALIQKLMASYSEKAKEYLFIIATEHAESDFKFNAAQLLFDNFEVASSDKIKIYHNLDSSDLNILIRSDIIDCIENELGINTPNYQDLYNNLNELSSNTVVDEVIIENLSFKAMGDDRIKFSGDMELSVTLEWEHEEMGGMSFPGKFSGYFDKFGIYLESATVRHSQFLPAKI